MRSDAKRFKLQASLSRAHKNSQTLTQEPPLDAKLLALLCDLILFSLLSLTVSVFSVKMKKLIISNSFLYLIFKDASMPIALIIGGASVSYATYLWWINELGGFMGRNAKDIGLTCLLRAGTGDCAQLWFMGMHSTNQFASLAFYAGIGAIIAGLILLVPKSY